MIACFPMINIITSTTSWQEDAVAVRRREKLSFHAVLCRPYIGGILAQLHPLPVIRDTPLAAPMDLGGIVILLQEVQPIGKALAAIARVVAILGKLFVPKMAVFVCIPTEDVF